MTGNRNLISRCIWIYVTCSGGGGETAHTGAKIVNISRLEQLIVPLLDSEILTFDIFQLRHGERLATATEFLDAILSMLHFLVEVIKQHTPVLKWLRYLVLSS